MQLNEVGIRLIKTNAYGDATLCTIVLHGGQDGEHTILIFLASVGW